MWTSKRWIVILAAVSMVTVGAPGMAGDLAGSVDEPGPVGDATGSTLAQGLVDEGPRTPLDVADARIDELLAGAPGEVPADLVPALEHTRDKIETARTLVAITESEDTPIVDRVEAISAELHRWQAATLGVVSADARPSPTPAAPSEAIDALLAHHGASLDPGQQEVVRALDDLPGDLPSALVEVIVTFHRLEQATAQAYADVDIDRMEALLEQLEPLAQLQEAGQPLTDEVLAAHGWPEVPGPGAPLILAGGEPGPVLDARQAFVEASLDLWKAQRAVGEDQLEGVDPVVVPGVLAIDTAGEDSTYEEDLHLIVEMGGEDTYTNNAGGSPVGVPECSKQLTTASASALIDLDGDDSYGYRGARCGTNGGGHFGVGTLVDLAGSDTYLARGHGVNGAGAWGGFGLLLDAGQGDEYLAPGPAVNGGAAFTGAGMLIDTPPLGETLRSSHTTGDNETGGSYGGNEAADRTGLGSGINWGGDDVYEARGAGENGGGFYFASGFKVDVGGDDVYDVGGWGTNGGAANGRSSGFLLDVGGSDLYEAKHAGTNGGGSSGGLGVLLDTGDGDDVLTARHSGTNGGARYSSVGLHVNEAGDDLYEAWSAGVNGGVDAGHAGALVDTSGTDTYEEDDEAHTGEDVTSVPKGTLGAQLDLDPAPTGGAP